MRRACGIIVAFLVALALAAPAAAQPPADGWQGWTWSSVIERLTDWAGEALGVLSASETTSDPQESEPPTAPPPDPVSSLSGVEPGQETEAIPEFDPNG